MVYQNPALVKSIKWKSSEIIEEQYPLQKATLSIQNQSFSILIQDEYNDLKINNPLLNLCLVLRELEVYKESRDYLDWCNIQNVEANSEELRQYYMRLCKTCQSIEEVIGKIDSQISDLDFQLNSGAAKELRKLKL